MSTSNATSNLAQLYYVAEATCGVTPATPVMKRLRFTNESLNIDQGFEQSEEITGNRIIKEIIPVSEAASGSIGWELSHGVLDDFFESAMLSTFTKTAERDNDGSAASVITDVAAASDTFTVTSGTAFAANQLVRTTGFGESANNSLFKVVSGSATTCVVGDFLADEASPAADARVKAVGFEGDTGDVTATASGLGSTALDFTTLGLTPGQWLKIGGSAAGEQFDTAALNDYVRIDPTGTITATAIPLDNLPTGWGVDAAAGKTIRVWTSDYIEVGSTIKSFSLEKVFTGQATPSYISYVGKVVNTLNITADAQSRLLGSFDMIGFGGAEDTTSIAASVVDAPSDLIMNTSTNIGRVMENGSDQASPVWFSSASLSLNNNIQAVTALKNKRGVDYVSGDAALTVNLTATFGNRSLYQRFLNNTLSNFAFSAARNNKGYVFDCHAMTFTAAPVGAAGRNQIVNTEMTGTGHQHPTTGKMFAISEFEEVQS